MNVLMLCAVVTPMYVADCTPVPAGRTVTLGSVAQEQVIRAPNVTEAVRRFSDPQRPRDCARYVIDPNDPCY
jgi:hypothetical protein